jgi:hypothetical protein
MWGSVAPTSRQTYALGWARWREFVTVIGTDFAMAAVPRGIAEALEGLSWPEACVIAFLSFLRDGSDRRGVVEPATAFNYLCGARFFLKNHNVNTSFMEGSEAISTVKRGMMLSFRATSGNLVADRVILPFTLDLITDCIAVDLSRFLVMDQFTAMALKLGLGCLFRKCEYIRTRRTDHHLRAMDVTFVLELVPGRSSFVTAHQARDLAISALRDIVIFVCSAKNDFEGVGNKIAFQVRELCQGGIAVSCIFTHSTPV